MIVTCESCETSFQLDESRIPASGARVRCSRCKHAFFLANPSASQAEVADSIAAEAAQGAGVAPEPSSDLNADTWDGLNGESPTPAGASDDAAPGATSASDAPKAAVPEPDLEDEEEWQFTEEIRTEGDEPDDELGGAFGDGLDTGLGDDLDAELSADFAEGFDDTALGGGFASPSESVDAQSDPAGGFDANALSMDTGVGGLGETDPAEPEIASVAQADDGAGSGLDLGAPDPDAIGEEPGHDESSFGTVDDFSSLMEDEEPAADVAAAAAGEPAAELDTSDADEPVGTYSGRGQTDDLGDPESWDLVGSDDVVAASAGRALGGGGSLASALDAASADEFFSGDVDDRVAAPDLALATQSFAAGPIGRLARAVGWAATLAAMAFVAQAIFHAETGRWSEGPVAVSAGPIAARTVDGGWLRTTRSGAVLRVAGEVENTSGAPVTPGAVQLVLLDARGQRLVSPAIAAGLPLAPRILRESAGPVLSEQAAAAARRFAATPLAPGETRPFEVLIPEDRLPEEAARFDLEVGTSQPAGGASGSQASPAAASAQAGQLVEPPSLP